jgi:ATP-dependent DNA helicase RecG
MAKQKGRQQKLSLQPPALAVEQTWTPDEIFAAIETDLTVIERFKEDKRVERKPARIHARDLGDYLSVYANRQPHGGIILVGITDDGDIEGCSSLGSTRLNDLERAGSIYCPDARIETRSIRAYNRTGKPDFFLAIRVHYRADKLVETVRGEAFTRDGSSKRKLSEQEKREIRIKKREIDFEREDVPLRWPADFDQMLVHEYVTNYAATRKLTHHPTPEEILASTRLGRLDGSHFHPNVACALLFARDPRTLFPGAYIRFMRFAGRQERTGQKYNLIEGKDFWIDGPLPRLIAEADDVIGSEIRKFTRLGSDGKFQTNPEYPKEAWLEAIVNACAHRSYNFSNMAISVKMFDDRIVVESPGGFHPPTTANTISTIGHNPRNPHLMNALFYFELVKCAREGTARMRESMSAAELPAPEFSEVDADGNMVRVILRNDIEHRKSFIDADIDVPISVDLYVSLTERERAIVNYLAEHRQINITEAKNILDVHWNTAKRTIDALIAKNICKYEPRRGQKARDPTRTLTLKT